MKDSFDKWFFVIHRAWHAFMRERLGELGMEPRLLRFVHHLHDVEGLSQEDLSVQTGLDKTTVAHAVKRLVNLGYVSRERCAEDRRCYRLCLTPKGKQLARAMIEAMEQWSTGLTVGFGEDEVRALESCLRRMAENAAMLRERSSR